MFENLLLALEAGRDPELCRLPAPVENRRKSDQTSEGLTTVERPKTLAITSRPRPSGARHAGFKSLSSPSSGSESPATTRRFNESIGSESLPTGHALHHSHTSQALVPANPHSTNPYFDPSNRLNIFPIHSSPSLGSRNNRIYNQSGSSRGSPGSQAPDDPSPFDGVKFPPLNPNMRQSDSHQPIVPKKSVHFATSDSHSRAKLGTYQTQRSLLDENMGEEQDIHNPLLCSKPQTKKIGSLPPTENCQKPAYNYQELAREFL